MAALPRTKRMGLGPWARPEYQGRRPQGRMMWFHLDEQGSARSALEKVLS